MAIEIASISAALQGVKVLKELIFASTELNKKTEISMAVADVMEKLADAQSSIISSNNELLTLQAKYADLEKQLAEIENWKNEANRYHLHEIGPQVFTYKLKESHADREPIHYLCTNCYSNRKKSILNLVTSSSDAISYSCPSCPTKYFVNYHAAPLR